MENNNNNFEGYNIPKKPKSIVKIIREALSNQYAATVLAVVTIVGCGKDPKNPNIESFVKIENATRLDADNDGKPDDALVKLNCSGINPNSVEVLVNNYPATQSGVHEFTTLNLKEGLNKISVSATGLNGKELQASGTVVYEEDTDTPVETNEAPVISNISVEEISNDGKAIVSFEARDKETNAEDLAIETIVIVNGNQYPVTLTENNQFEAEVQLTEGDNTICIKTSDGENDIQVTEQYTYEQPDTVAPEVSLTTNVADLDGEGHPNDVVIQATASDPNGVKSVDAAFNGTDVKLDENGEAQLYNVPAGTHEVRVTAIDNNNNISTEESTVEVTEGPELKEVVDLPDVTYVRSIDNQEVTEDISYTSVDSSDGTPVVVKINGDETEYVLTGFDEDGNPLYKKTRAELRAELEKTSYGDGFILDMAYTYANGGYGVKGFKVVRDAPSENGGTGTSLENQHGEIVSLEGYKKGIQYVKDQLGVSSNAFEYAPNQAFETGNDTKLNWQIARAFTVVFGKKMQLAGATDKNTMFDRAAEAFQQVKNMTLEERRNLMLTIATEEGLARHWD